MVEAGERLESRISPGFGDATLHQRHIDGTMIEQGEVFNRTGRVAQFDSYPVTGQCLTVALAKQMVGTVDTTGRQRECTRRGRFDKLVGNDEAEQHYQQRRPVDTEPVTAGAVRRHRRSRTSC